MDATQPATPLRSFRQSAGLSIRDLERVTGINRGRLSILERGVPPTPDEHQAIMAAITAAMRAPKEGAA